MPISIIIAIVCGVIAPAQQTEMMCKLPIQYENRNQVDPQAINVHALSGRVFAEVGEGGGSPREVGTANGACVALFTEKEHRLVVAVTADENGNFDIDGVPVGSYRMVVHANALCVANVPLRVLKERPKKGTDRKRIAIHMRAGGYDTCSYVDFQ